MKIFVELQGFISNADINKKKYRNHVLMLFQKDRLFRYEVNCRAEFIIIKLI